MRLDLVGDFININKLSGYAEKGLAKQAREEKVELLSLGWVASGNPPRSVK